jgi:uncharacterized protein (DUF2235 family)
MPKNVVLCCDGTANEFAQDRTNVVKLFSALEPHNSSRQVAYYHPGLGTMEPAAEISPIRRQIARVLGQAVGYGLEFDIRDAYAFVMNHYEEGDRLFLFGFSRGAYTVRAVAALLKMYWLIAHGNEPLIPYAIRMMLAIHRLRERGGSSAEIHEYFRLADDFKKTFAAFPCHPHFVGVWDTVSSLGWYDNPLKLPYTAENADIEIGRHAISIDERRAFFRTNLWMPDPPTAQTGPKDLKQVWFAGVHADVGGGYPEAESGLSKIALEWMLDEAVSSGLHVDPMKRDAVLGRGGGTEYVRPDPTGLLHRSLRGWWWLAEFIWKRHYNWEKQKSEHRMNRGRPRTIAPGSVIHPSVQARMAADPAYRPPNLTPSAPAVLTSPIVPSGGTKGKTHWVTRLLSGVEWIGIALVIVGLFSMLIEAAWSFRCALVVVVLGAVLRGLAGIGLQRLEK